MLNIPFTGLLSTEDLLQVFHKQNIFYKSSLNRSPLTGLLQTEDLTKLFHRQNNSIDERQTISFSNLLWTEVFLPVLSKKKTVNSSSVTCLLQAEDFPMTLYGQKIFYRPSLDRRLFTRILQSEDLSDIYIYSMGRKRFADPVQTEYYFHDSNLSSIDGRTYTGLRQTEDRSTIENRPFTEHLCMKDFLRVFPERKTFGDLLQTEVHSEAIKGQRSFAGLNQTYNILQIFYRQKNFYRSSVYRRPCTGVLQIEHFTQVSRRQKSFYISSVDKISFSNLVQTEG